MSRRIAILGAGRLGESLARGFLKSGWREPADLAVTVRRPERIVELRERYGLEALSDNAFALSGAPLIIIAVKPQDIAAVIAEIGPSITPDQTVLSVAAGVTTGWIESHLPEGSRVVRAM